MASLADLPSSAAALADASWDDILPYYEELASRPIGAEGMDDWLRDWSHLEELVGEAAERAYVAYTTDTMDPAKEEANLRFMTEIVPRMEEQRVRLSRRLVESGFTRDDLETVIRRWRNQIDLFREENVPIQAELGRLSALYEKITGGMTVMWDGEEKTLPELSPYLQETDRAVRERAFRLQAQPFIDRRDELAGLFDQQLALREQLARNAGFGNFRDYAFREKDRFDYTPADCERFHAAVEATVVPAVARLNERRRRRLGVDTLRPWDLDVDPEGRPGLRPFDDVATLVGRAEQVFARVDPVLGGYFTRMAQDRLLDLDSRKGKAPGGYCIGFEHVGLPFIFMNAVGTAQDVQTLHHEAGHAFHVFESGHLPLVWQRHTGEEFAEVASMTMELLTAPFLAADQGGYYSAADARRQRIEHLEGILRLLAHIASIDAFQHWIYVSGEGHDRDARDAAWLRIRDRFEPGIDWRGLEPQRLARWYRQLHIFLYPFYYIEYGIAQLGALQIWRDSQADRAAAVARYRRALALGGTRPLPDLFAAAGARMVFDAETMGELVALVDSELVRLERGATG